MTPDHIWTTVFLSYQGLNHLKSNGSYFNKFNEDTLVDGKHYLKVFRSTDSLKLNWEKIGIIREEEGKVFYRDYFHDYDVFMYNFNLAVGDTFYWNYFTDGYLEKYIVTSIDSIQISGIFRKHMKLTETVSKKEEVWIDGVGSLEGILYSCNVNRIGAYPHLACQFKNEQLIYHNQDFPKCFYSKGEYDIFTRYAVQGRQIFRIFPNPFNDKLNIISENQISEIKIMDLQGRVIQVANGICTKSPINLTTKNIPSGVYFIKLLFNNNESSDQTIIKIIE